MNERRLAGRGRQAVNPAHSPARASLSKILARMAALARRPAGPPVAAAVLALSLSAPFLPQPRLFPLAAPDAKQKGRIVKSYETHFGKDENPISEGGVWLNGKADGIDWYDVITRNGVAYGAVTTGAFTDPTALLKGKWGRNQTAVGTVFSRNQTDRCNQEVELRLRSALAPHVCTGYEVFWRCLKTDKAYVEIVRWNGKVEDWTSIQKHTGAQFGVKNGDVVKATITGNVIKGYLNGVEMISVTDDTYSSGNPGIGFNFGVGETNADFGFTSYKVESTDD